MSEKTKFEKMSNSSMKPVPMKLFAAWEVDRTPPNCIPRLCSLTITRLTLLSPLPPDVTSVSLAVKMHSSKRTLRSHEITIPVNTTGLLSGVSGLSGTPQTPGTTLLDTELDLHFSLQYPHFIKRDGNRLQILLQRRKKYKSRTILGYKTLCEGSIRMDQAMQRARDMLIELGGGKGVRQGTPLARLSATSVASIPVDHDNKNNNSGLLADRIAEYSDEDEEAEFSSVEENDEGNDVLSAYGGAKRAYCTSKRGVSYRKLQRAEESPLGGHGDSDSEFEHPRKGQKTVSSRQRNFKQKFVALLRRFRVPDEMEVGGAQGGGALGGDQEIDALFQELESLSCGEGDESGPELDTMSIGSTPKPSLRPFFSSSKSLLHESVNQGALSLPPVEMKPHRERQGGSSQERERRGDSSGNEATGPGGTSEPQTDPEPCSSDPQNTNSPPRDKENSDRRSRLFRAPLVTGPTQTKKKHSLSISMEPRSLENSLLSPTNIEPRRSLMDALSKALPPEELGLPDALVMTASPEPPNSPLAARIASMLTISQRPVLSPYNGVEVRAILTALLSKIHKYCNSNAKPPPPVKILLLGGDSLLVPVLKYYVELLGLRPPDWLNHIRFYIIPIGVSNVSRYMCFADPAYCQLFGGDNWQHLLERVSSLEPLKSDVQDICNRVQRYVCSSASMQFPIAEAMVSTKEEDSGQNFVPFISDVRVGSLEGPQASLDLEENCPPLSSSPPLGGFTGRISPPVTPVPPDKDKSDPVELQIDYWQISKQGAIKSQVLPRGTDQPKSSLKCSFRSLQVLRPPEASTGLSMSYATKEKKQKIMRLGKKKEKDRDGEREQNVDGVSRLICSPKPSHGTPLRVLIDGAEWNGVKFFQLSWQWQTHVKNFPVALVGAPLAPSEIA